jgi:acetyltransferase-like isoleucine patch superfamily enzyme
MLFRALGRPTCKKHRTTRLLPSARIVNIGRDSNLIKVGAHTIVGGELLVFPHGGAIEIGEWCFIGQGTRIWSGARISIGNRVMISHGVNIFDNLTHPIAASDRHAHFKEIYLNGHPANISLGDRPVQIQDDAWIGAAATVLRGLTIGRGAIVGAGAVVTHDVMPLTIVAGNPARIIRELPQ